MRNGNSGEHADAADALSGAVFVWPFRSHPRAKTCSETHLLSIRQVIFLFC